MALIFGAENQWLDVHELASGGTACVSVGLNQLLASISDKGVTVFSLAHNHPSGNFMPSEVDIQSTLEAEAGAQNFGVRLDDHFIVAGDKIFSMRHWSLVSRRQDIGS